MDENEYRSTYREVNALRCVYEKAINSRQCFCQQAERFNLADREGVRCSSACDQLRCEEILTQLRHKASFALQMTRVDAPLPHAKEIRVQVGGILGLQRLLVQEVKEQVLEKNTVPDIKQVLDNVWERYPNIENLPFTQIVQNIVKYEGRSRRPRGKKDN